MQTKTKQKIHQRSEKDYGTRLIKRVKNRFFRKNIDWFACVVGDRGSGKSLTAVTLAHAIDPTFDVQKDILFSFSDFLSWMNTRGKRGKAVIIDEMGTSFNARKWQSSANILFGEILQTNRSMNLCVICTVPFFSFVDIQGRKLFHTVIDCVLIDYDKDYCFVRWFNLGKTHYGQEILYYKRPRIDGRIIRFIKVPKVPKHIEKQYTKLANTYKKTLRQVPKSKEEIRTAREQKKQDLKRAKTEKIWKEIIDNEMEDVGKIAIHFNVAYSTAHQYKALAMEWAKNREKDPKSQEKPKDKNDKVLQ